MCVRGQDMFEGSIQDNSNKQIAVIMMVIMMDKGYMMLMNQLMMSNICLSKISISSSHQLGSPKAYIWRISNNLQVGCSTKWVLVEADSNEN